MASSSLKKISFDLLARSRSFFSSNRPLGTDITVNGVHPLGVNALFDAHNLGSCRWPETADGRYAEAFLTPLIEKGVSHYIENVRTDLLVLAIDGIVLPVTVNEGEYDNSYVCSPYSFFISYARESLDFIPQPWLRQSIRMFLDALGKRMQGFELNKAAAVNNWFFSTNLYPPMEERQVISAVHTLQDAFPEHAIVFRCVDPFTNPVCYRILPQLGFEMIATRQIYFLDTNDTSFFSSRLFKSDLKLLKNSGYEIIGDGEIKEEEIPRLLELYRDLYLDKYSTLNPNYSEEFVRLALKQNLLQFIALKKEGRIDAVAGFVERDGKMYCPFFGYDSKMPQEIGLYRILSTALMLEAKERKLFFHQSSGASMYKKIRKAKGAVEYTAVYYKHLKIQRHLPWMMLKNLYNTAGIVFMKRY